MSRNIYRLGGTMYRLVTIGEEVSLTLYFSESSDKEAALDEIRRWAIAHKWKIKRHENDTEGDCVIQELTPVND